MTKIKKKVISKIEKNSVAKSVLHNGRYRIVLTTFTVLVINIGYALYNGVLGIIYGSLWFLTMFAYYAILSAMRFGTVLCERRNNKTEERKSEMFVMKFAGIMLIILSFVLAGSVYYSTVFEVAKKNGKIVMITIATYTFYKITVAIINMVKVKKHNSPLLTTIRNISCADAAVSVLSLQRSMLISFEGKSNSEIGLMNVITGAVVCLFVLTLGVIMSVRYNRN